MARIRTIKPEFWKHEGLSELPEATHMLAAQLLNYSDDEGYFNANPALIKAECSPLREPSVSIQDSLQLLSSEGYLQLGTGANGRRYGRIVEFRKHQTISRPSTSKIKDLEIAWDDSGNTHGALHEDSTAEQGTGNREQGKEPPNPPEGGGDGFDEFWSLYPKRVAKPQAHRAWRRLNASDRERVMADVPARIRGDPQWLKDGTQFVPNPATYLNQRRFDDDWQAAKANGTTGEPEFWT